MAVPPVLYLGSIGDILTRITCSHILLLSENVFYSHNNINIDYHTFTVLRNYWSLSNFSTVPHNFKLPYWERKWQYFHILGTMYNVTGERGILQRKNFGNVLPLDGRIYIGTTCIYSIVLFPQKRVWNFAIRNKPTLYFPVASSFGNLRDFPLFKIKLPTILLEVTDASQHVLSPEEVYGLKKASQFFTNLIAIQRCALKYSKSSLLSDLINCTYRYFCIYCFPNSKFLTIDSDRLFNLTSFLGFIAIHGTPKYFYAAIIYGEHLSEYRARRNIFRFQKKSRHDFRVVMAHMVIEKSKHNLTLFLTIKSLTKQQRKYVDLQPDDLLPTLYAEARMEPKSSGTLTDSDRDFMFIVVGKTGYRFLTCYSNEFLNFRFYALPFQSNLWIGVLVTIPVLITCFWLLLGNLGYLRKQRFSPLLYMIQCLLENGPTLPKSVESNLVAKTLLATWLLLSIIAANGYKGIISTDITAPLPNETPYKLFGDLLQLTRFKAFQPKPGIKLYAEMSKKCLEDWQQSKIFQRPIPISNFRGCRTMSDLELGSRGKYQDVLFKWILAANRSVTPNHFYNASEEDIVAEGKDYWLPSKQNLSDISFEAALESEIVQCENKAVLIGKDNYIWLEQQYLQEMYPLKTFFVSRNKSMLAQHVVWRFNNLGETRVAQRLVGFVENGI